ncbi:MAG: hypothetical protein Q4Q53_01860 [Methanocorpusculum sp.]|nr:hypothetical protein [Methanocorpusculum sp.]
MAKLQKSKTNGRKKKSFSAVIIIAVTALIIIFGVILAGLFMSGNTSESIIESQNIPITCTVSGNDIIVTVMKSAESDYLKSIEINMQGFEIPPGYSVRELADTDYPKIVSYKNIVAGMSGVLMVSFIGYYYDGSHRVLWRKSVKIS